MGEIIDEVWPCRCWFCRLFTRRVLNYFARGGAVSLCEGGGGEVVVASSEADLAKELRSLRDGLEELKRAVAEIKAVVADLTGPYSLYKPPEQPVQQTAQLQQAPASGGEGTKSISQPVSGGGGEVKPSTLSEAPGVTGLGEITGALSEISGVLREERARVASYSLKRVIGLIRTIHELRRLYPRSSVESIVTVLEKLGVVSDKELELLKASMDLVEEGLKQGVSTEESALMMYLLLKNLGVRDEELEDEAMRVVLQALMVRKVKAGETSTEGGSDKWASQQQ